MKRLTVTTGIASLLFLLFLGTLITLTRIENKKTNVPAPLTIIARAHAQEEFLAMDTAFRAIVNAPTKAWTFDAKRIDRIMAAFEKRRSTFSQRLAEMRAGVESPDEAQVLARLDADLVSYRALTDAPDEATNAKLTPVVNAVNGDFDALETFFPEQESHAGIAVNGVAAGALGLSLALLAALVALLLRRQIGESAEATEESSSSASSLEIINRLWPVTNEYGIVETEPVAPRKPIFEEPERLPSDPTIDDFTQHIQQLISALFSLNAVADSTMSEVGTLADTLEKSPDRLEIERVSTELQALTAAMHSTVQQLSSSTTRMQSQVIHMMKVLEHL